MENTKNSSSSKILIPLHSLLFVAETGTTKIDKTDITPYQVGEKAYGLSCLPKAWTLPFIVVSGKLYSLYRTYSAPARGELITSWAQQIIEAALTIGIQKEDSIIVRSSGQSEGLEDRGKFYSVEGVLINTPQALESCLEKLASDRDLGHEEIPLIIQKYAIPISAKGHLSNERRFYKEGRDWIGEYEEVKNGTGGGAFQINLRNWREKISPVNETNKALFCNLSAHVAEILKIPAAWGHERGLRIHFEWVWDGNFVYLVQADQEYEAKGVNPTEIFSSVRDLSTEFSPKCLKLINKSHAQRYNKIRNVFTYMELGLPFTKLYVLDDQNIIKSLAAGIVPPDLEHDLSELVKGSLVIRMDISTEDISRRQLLPRTHEVRDLESALTWLKSKSAEIKHHNIRDDVVLIFHNFVPATSSAFAYAAPGERKVQLEALWGLPEGLYYNSHDKYIVDTLTSRPDELIKKDISQFKVQVKPSFKRFFVAPDSDGRWTTQSLKRPYDWRDSIQNIEWVKEIALESRRIAEEEKRPLSIMWFVGVPEDVCSRPVFPWYHEPYDRKINSRAITDRTKTPFDESLVIRSSSDIEVLRQEVAKERSSVRRIRIQPSEEALLRNKDTLRVIGELTKRINAIILLEGGVLSHAYYQLMETNAIVEVLHPFDGFEDKQEFNKLVRDRVPSNIEDGGEIVRKARLSGEYLLRALREKLIEESFEVLDATDQDSIVGELADVSEIIDGILNQLGVSRDELKSRQDNKRETAGGFLEGLVLLETKNPIPTHEISDGNQTLFDDLNLKGTQKILQIDGREFLDRSHAIHKKWSDRREHQAATETILNLMVPVVRDNWTAKTSEMTIENCAGNVIQVIVKGQRLGSKIQVDLSIFNPKKQLDLF